jgi:hypothetical protein
MRNEWFPSKKAEYMTKARFIELGVTRSDVSQRDALFGLGDREVVESEADAEQEVQPGVKVRSLAVSLEI